MARTAVVAGTATAVSGRVAQAQHSAQQAPSAQAPAPRPSAEQAPAERPPAGADHGIDQLHGQLTKLGELWQAGLLTDEEFAAQKARVLGAARR